jgi:hypothetical protein
MSPITIVLVVGLVGATLYVGRTVRSVLLQRRNLKHYERDEPLEGGVDKWD